MVRTTTPMTMDLPTTTLEMGRLRTLLLQSEGSTLRMCPGHELASRGVQIQ